MDSSTNESPGTLTKQPLSVQIEGTTNVDFLGLNASQDSVVPYSFTIVATVVDQDGNLTTNVSYLDFDVYLFPGCEAANVFLPPLQSLEAKTITSSGD